MDISDLSEKTLYEYSNTIFAIAQLVESHIKAGEITLVSNGVWLKVLSFTRQFLAHSIVCKVPELRGMMVQNILNLYYFGEIDLHRYVDVDSEMCYYYPEDNFIELCIEYQHRSDDILPLFRKLEVINSEILLCQFEEDCDENPILREIFKKTIKALYSSRY
jgi:hypothetical protein